MPQDQSRPPHRPTSPDNRGDILYGLPSYLAILPLSLLGITASSLIPRNTRPEVSIPHLRLLLDLSLESLPFRIPPSSLSRYARHRGYERRPVWLRLDGDEVRMIWIGEERTA